MKKKRLFWLILPSYWILTALTIISVAAYAFHNMKGLYFQTLQKDLLTRTQLMSEILRPAMVQTPLQLDLIKQQCKSIGNKVTTRVTIIDPSGKVLADSDEEAGSMEYHGNRPEIRQALSGTTGTHQRYSRTLKQEMMYLALPLRDDNGEIVCAIRTSLPMTHIERRLNAMTARVIQATLLIGLLTMAVCILVVRNITTPLRNMSSAAMRFAEGDFSRRLPTQQTIELNQLTESLNIMSERLSSTLSTISEQRNEQQAVLSSMDEGVLAIDRKERIIHLNRAAGDILNIEYEQIKRPMVQQVIRFANLLEFIKAVLSSRTPISRDLNLMGKAGKKIQAHGTALKNDDGDTIGALIILRDVTQLRHLETVRSDFVANVSHELKTPITSIKGFVETLLSNEWNHSPEIIRFLEIINQQSGRLNAIIDDLLTLSRLEQKNGIVIKEDSSIATALQNASYLCQLQANKKQMHIETTCPDDLKLNINAPLLEQALVNLIINAIKYSDPQKTVRLFAEKQRNDVVIYVQDEGFGIENKHLDRLFERFYRVDTARSRKLGGTGLGLSIVKHIVSAHNGTISVESKLGAGSTFIIRLPIIAKGQVAE
jgi:two-component system, OmpR family, phosphate regulon sensor histidine kinase PhoR